MINNHLLSFIPIGIEKFKSIEIRIELDPTIPSEFKAISTINSINTHIFKPKFYECNHQLFAFAHSMDSALQTQKAIQHYLEESGIEPIVFEIIPIEVTEKYSSYIKPSDLCEDVVIGQFYSVVAFFYAYAIGKFISVEKASNFLLKINRSKIKLEGNNKNYSDQEHIVSELKKVLNQEEIKELNLRLQIIESVDSPYIKQGTISLEGKKISVMQRPWGKILTKELARNLEQVPRVKNIYYIGGCAGLMPDMKVDDLVVPDPCLLVDYSVSKMTNINLLITHSTKDFLSKKHKEMPNVHFVPFYTVDSSLFNNELYKSLFTKGVGAIDMELSALITNLPTKEVYPLFYIMDLPNQGIGLSQTYYDLEFLSELTKKKVRGNHLCHQIVAKRIFG